MFCEKNNIGVIPKRQETNRANSRVPLLQTCVSAGFSVSLAIADFSLGLWTVSPISDFSF